MPECAIFVVASALQERWKFEALMRGFLCYCAAENSVVFLFQGTFVHAWAILGDGFLAVGLHLQKTSLCDVALKSND